MIQSQVYVFLWSILIGAILAFVFDLFRVSRRKGGASFWIVCLQDILYFFIVAFIIIMSTFVINDGELRGYMFIGYALGVMFYLLLLSKLVTNVLGAIFDFVDMCFSKVFNTTKAVFKRMNFNVKRVKKEKT